MAALRLSAARTVITVLLAWLNLFKQPRRNSLVDPSFGYISTTVIIASIFFFTIVFVSDFLWILVLLVVLNRPLVRLIQRLLARQHPSRQAFSCVVRLFVDFACVGVCPSGIKLLTKELRLIAEKSLLRR